MTIICKTDNPPPRNGDWATLGRLLVEAAPKTEVEENIEIIDGPSTDPSGGR